MIKTSLFIRTAIFSWLSCLTFVSCQTEAEPPFLMGQGTGIHNVTLMVRDLDEAMTYYEDTLGFSMWGDPEPGVYEGSKSAVIALGDMTAFEILSPSDTAEEGTVTRFITSFLEQTNGIRLFSLSSSSVDSASIALVANGFQLDSVYSYRTSTGTPEGWSWDDGDPKRKRLDFIADNPPAQFPQFIERIEYDYPAVRDEWNTYYIYRRWFNDHPNGVVGMRAIRLVVKDLEFSSQEYQKMGLNLIEQSDSIARFRVFRHQELHLLKGGTHLTYDDFLEKRDEGVFAIRFDVSNLDSTHQFMKEKLPEMALNRTSGQLTVSPDYAFGVQLEFVQEPEEQGVLARTLTPEEGLDSLAVQHATGLYTKYCALCHGENREGYAADHAPSLRSNSLLATSSGTNFLRYTIQYGRANTAMAGYLDRQGGPLEYIEIELLLQWLYETSGVEEPIELSREPVLGDIELGASVYQENCTVCHGENGEGISAPALSNPMLLATATDHFLRYAIAEGREGTPMIAFKDSLSAEKLDGLTAFLRSRASGWDIPEPDTVSIPSPEDYVLNPENEAPVFDLREGKYVSSAQVNQALQDSLRMVILDARSEVAWRQMHIPGAIPVPYYEDPENFVGDIPNDGTQIVIYCACPHAASNRVRNTLKRNGFENAVIIDEGILVWAQMGYPVRNGR